jgi:hypothetical protein
MTIRKDSLIKKCRNSILALLSLLLVLVVINSGCAPQHKYKKIKAVPCPCEKIQKR